MRRMVLEIVTELVDEAINYRDSKKERDDRTHPRTETYGTENQYPRTESQETESQVWSPEVLQELLKPWSQGHPKTLATEPVMIRQRKKPKLLNNSPHDKLKQTKMLDYLKRKSPKATRARERQNWSLESETGAETERTQNQGALKSPLSGDFNYPGPQILPPEGPGPVPAERGGGWDDGDKKKALKALERMPPDRRTKPGGLEKSRSKKRTLETQGGKEPKKSKRIEGRKIVFLKEWFKTEEKGSGGHPPDPGGRNTGPGTDENQQEGEPKVWNRTPPRDR